MRVAGNFELALRSVVSSSYGDCFRFGYNQVNICRGGVCLPDNNGGESVWISGMGAEEEGFFICRSEIE